MRPTSRPAWRRPLLRAHVSFATMWAGESAFVVVLAVFAFGRGGVVAVGVVTAVRMATAALVSPALATLADRTRREHVLLGVSLVRTTTLAGAALVAATGGPVAATYGCAVVATVALGLFRPAHSALLPALAGSPGELTSANAVRGLLDSVATLGGPVLAATLLATSGPAVAFAACAALSLVAGLAVVRLRYDAPPRAVAVREPARRAVLGGFATIAHDRRLVLITSLGVVQTFTRGALTVLGVVVAIDLLGLGDPGVGILGAAIGAGGVLGSLLTFRLVRRGGLGTWFGIGIALFGAPLVGLGLVPSTAAAVLLLGVVGAGNALIDVSAFTMLARLTDERVLARMFAGFEALLTLGVALGGLVTPGVVDLLGARAALVAVGLLAPVAVLVCSRWLRRLDADLEVRDADVVLLRTVPMLAVLPATTIDQLGSGLTHAAYAPGEVIVEQGGPGDAYYVVESGLVEVVRNGAVVNTLAVGAGFGEIALLDDRPRTATVRAAEGEPVRVAGLSRAAFLTAVTGYPVSATVGAETVRRVRARDADVRDDDAETGPSSS